MTPSTQLLKWYDAEGRDLAWRVKGGRADPYRVWLSEIMLQQTTVVVVTGYYKKFLNLWPQLEDLAAAELDDVLRAWAGLGYYSRARNLHRCARQVRDEHGGCFPDDQTALEKLPGIGPYTAAAMTSIAFDQPANVVDGNVERVMARYFNVATPLPGAKAELTELAATLLPKRRHGDYAQALMDLGATVCTPRKALCSLCPWSAKCQARAAGDPESLPRRAPKKQKPVRRGVAFWLQRRDGSVLLRRRPEKGLLGGMMEVPSSAWEQDGSFDLEVSAPQAPALVEWTPTEGVVRHTFTHFHLELVVLTGVMTGRGKVDGNWVALKNLEAEALPSIMRKVAAHAIAATEDEFVL